MALPTTNIKLGDVYKEIYWVDTFPYTGEYTPPGQFFSRQGTSLLRLLGDSNLLNKSIPVNLGRFAGYEHRRVGQLYVSPYGNFMLTGQQFSLPTDLKHQLYRTKPDPNTDFPAFMDFHNSKWYVQLVGGSSINSRFAYDVHAGASWGNTNHPFANFLKYKNITNGVVGSTQRNEWYIGTFKRKLNSVSPNELVDCIYHPTYNKWYYVSEVQDPSFPNDPDRWTFPGGSEEGIHGVYLEAPEQIKYFINGWGDGHYLMSYGAKTSTVLGTWVTKQVELWGCYNTTDNNGEYKKLINVKYLSTEVQSFQVYDGGTPLDSGMQGTPHKINGKSGEIYPSEWSWMGKWYKFGSGKPVGSEIEFPCSGGQA
jgi:hypothetical protein